MVRDVAGHDPARVEETWNRPLRDVFLAYIEQMRRRALERYRAELLVWAVLAPYQKRGQSPPSIPSILK